MCEKPQRQLYERASDVTEEGLGSERPELAVLLINRAKMLEQQARAIGLVQERGFCAFRILLCSATQGGINSEKGRSEPPKVP